MLKMIFGTEFGNTALHQFQGEMDGRQIRRRSLLVARQMFYLCVCQNIFLIVRGWHTQKTAAKRAAMFSPRKVGPTFPQLANKLLTFIEP
jgi:hypothetical protein